MSELGDRPPRPNDLPALEPWALELEQRERGHVDPRIQEELATVVAQLRGLPDPEPPPRLSEAILARVAADATRPRVLRGDFGRAARGAALALAAGVAGLMVLSGTRVEVSWIPAGASADAPGHVVIQLPPGAGAPPHYVGASAFPVRSGGRVAGQPQLVSLLTQEFEASDPGRADPQRVVSAWDRHLDHQLNQLLLDPESFAVWLEQVPRRDDLIARLARRAGERGDAPEVAMRVRESDHPVAAQIVHRMLRAALVEGVSPR